MSISNLHTLLNGKWFIEQSYAKSMTPLLVNVLKGKEIKSAKEDKPEISIRNTKGKAIAALPGNASNEKYVVVLELKNAIYKYDQECGPKGTKTKIGVLEQYRNDPNLAGIVLDIDSGGGQVSGTPEFHDYIKCFEKPVVAYTDGDMCSAAYYIGSAADYLIANKRAEAIGSIGVMISFIDWTGYIEKEGGQVITEYATLSTEKNKPFEQLLAGNAEFYIKEELDPINDVFHADVKNSRPNVNESVFTGKTWDAAGALEQGLIDEIGTLQMAISKVLELAAKSSNSNQINMSKTLPKLEAVLGLTAPLASTDNGSYLNEEQLDQLEATIANHDTVVADLNSQLLAAQDTTALDSANATVTAAETAVDAMLSAAGIPAVEGTTLDAKLASLNTKVTEMAKKPGAVNTVVKLQDDNSPEHSNVILGVDITEAMNY